MLLLRARLLSSCNAAAVLQSEAQAITLASSHMSELAQSSQPAALLKNNRKEVPEGKEPKCRRNQATATRLVRGKALV